MLTASTTTVRVQVRWEALGDEPLNIEIPVAIDGADLNDEAYRSLARIIGDAIEIMFLEMPPMTSPARPGHYSSEFVGTVAHHPITREQAIALFPKDYLSGDEFCVDKHDAEAIQYAVDQGGRWFPDTSDTDTAEEP